MRRFIPTFLAATCLIALLAGPAQAQRGWRGGRYSGSYYHGNYGHNYYGHNGYYGGYGYHYYPRFSYYGGYGYPYSGYSYGYNYPQYYYNYSYPQYYSGYSYPQYYSTPSSSSSIVYDTTPAQSTVSTSAYGNATTGNDQGWLRIVLPDPSARLMIQGQSMTQTGAERLFYTPRLQPGQTYTYNIRASWMENGQEVTREKKIDVTSGQTAVVNFNDRSATNNAESLPAATPPGN